MPKREKVRYNIDQIDKCGAQINLIYGERANGKSYQVKHKKAINQYLFDSNRFVADYKNKEKIIESVLKKRFKIYAC